MATILKEIRKKGVVYRVEIRREGTRITKRFPNKTLAKDWARKKESEISTGQYEPELKRYSLGDAM